MRRAAKRDDSEKGIVDAIEAVGRFRVVKFNDPKIWDMEVFSTTGESWRAEIKTGDADLTPGQQELFTALRAMGVVIHVWRTPLEALAALGCAVDEMRLGLKAAKAPEADWSDLDLRCERGAWHARQRLGIGAPAALVPPQSSTKALGPVRSKRGPTAAYVPPRTFTGPCSTPGCPERAMPSGSECTSCFLDTAGTR